MLLGCLQLDYGHGSAFRELRGLLMKRSRTSLNLHHGVGVGLLLSIATRLVSGSVHEAHLSLLLHPHCCSPLIVAAPSMLLLEHRSRGRVPLISHPYDDSSACLFRHCDPYDLLLSTPIEQRRNPMINRPYKCTKCNRKWYQQLQTPSMLHPH